MPLAAYGVLATFVAAATLIGSLVTWLVGPRRPWAVVLPVATSIVALGTVGHRFRLGVGPTVSLFGFEVRLAFDLGLALGVSLGVALGQRALLRALAARTSRARPGV